MKRIVFLAFLLTLVLSTGLVFAQDDVDPSGQTVVYWHQRSTDSRQGEAIAELVAQFNDTNEWGITVEAIHQGGYNEIGDLMNAAIISGELPNMVAGYQSAAISYALDGIVFDLNPYFDSEVWGFSEDELADLNVDVLNVDVFNAAPFDGARLAWPMEISANSFVVNLSILGELGFDGPPATFDDFMAAACAAAGSDLTGADDVAMRGYPIKGGSSDYESYLASHGGSIFDYDAGQYVFTDEANIATLTMYADLYANDCAYVPDSRYGNTDDFALGINPMAITSTAGIPFIAGGMADAGTEADWVVTTTPWTEGNRTLQVFVPSIIPVQGTPEQNLAVWLFLKFLSEEESQYLWSSRTSYFAVNSVAAERVVADIAEDNPYMAGVFELYLDPDVNKYGSPPLASYNSIRSLLAEAVADVTVNGMDVEEVAARLEEEANEVHAELSE